MSLKNFEKASADEKKRMVCNISNYYRTLLRAYTEKNRCAIQSILKYTNPKRILTDIQTYSIISSIIDDDDYDTFKIFCLSDNINLGSSLNDTSILEYLILYRNFLTNPKLWFSTLVSTNRSLPEKISDDGKTPLSQLIDTYTWKLSDLDIYVSDLLLATGMCALNFSTIKHYPNIPKMSCYHDKSTKCLNCRLAGYDLIDDWIPLQGSSTEPYKEYVSMYEYASGYSVVQKMIEKQIVKKIIKLWSTITDFSRQRSNMMYYDMGQCANM